MKKPEPGTFYEHFKGAMYKIVGIARHSETLEELVVYQAQYDDFDLWVRPLSMFLEKVTVSGKTMPRFRLKEDLDREID